MGFELQQNPSSLETVSKFTERIRTAIKEVKSVICKTQDNMKKYYDWWRALALVFNPSDKVFLDALDIWTMCLLQKLSHWWLSPFVVEQWVGPMAYHLKLPHWMNVSDWLKILILDKDQGSSSGLEENCKGTSRVVLSQDWGSVLLVAQWQYVYAFPSFLSSLCLYHVGDAFYLLLGHCDYWSMRPCDGVCDRLV